jgi:hypothetical protein
VTARDVPRPRKQRRERERELRKGLRDLERAAAAAPGGAAANPITVDSAAVVETRARATPCLQCGGDLDLRADRATSTARGVLRALDVICRRCHAPRTLWFLVAPRAPS